MVTEEQMSAHLQILADYILNADKEAKAVEIKVYTTIWDSKKRPMMYETEIWVLKTEGAKK